MFSSFPSLFSRDIKKLLKPWLKIEGFRFESIPLRLQKELYELFPKQPVEKAKLREELCGPFEPLQQNFDCIYEGLTINAARARIEEHKFYQEPNVTHRLQKVEHCINDNAKEEEYEVIENEGDEAKQYKELLIVERERLNASIQAAEIHFSHYNFDAEPVIAARRDNIALAIQNIDGLNSDAKAHCLALMNVKLNALNVAILAAEAHFNHYNFDAESDLTACRNNVVLAIQNINGLNPDAKVHCLALMNAKLHVLDTALAQLQAQELAEQLRLQQQELETMAITRQRQASQQRRRSPKQMPITQRYNDMPVQQLANIPSSQLTQEQIFRVCDYMGM